MQTNSISLGAAMQAAWLTYQKHAGLLAAILLTMFGAWVALEVIVISGQGLGWAWWGAAHLVFLYVLAGLEAGFLRTCLALLAGAEPRFADAFRYFRVGPALLAGQVMYLLLVAVGLVLLVAPGLYGAARYGLFGYSLVEGQTSLTRSFSLSARLSAGGRWRLGALWVALLGLNVLGAAVLGVGLLVTIPLSVLSMGAVYRQLSAGASGT